MKIPIPKEAVTQIMKDYNCSEEQAAKAFLDAQDRANEEFKSVLEERFGQCTEKVPLRCLCLKLYGH